MTRAAFPVMSRAMRMVGALCLAAWFVGWASAAPPTQGPRPEVVALVREFSQAPIAENWIKQNQARLTQAMLDEVERHANEWARANSFGSAYYANALLGLAYLTKGDRRKGLGKHIDAVEILYLQAESQAAYEQVYELAGSATRMGAGEKVPELTFRASLIGTEASYQAAKSGGIDFSARKVWQARALDGLVGTARLARHAESMFERFVSLSGAIVREALDEVTYGTSFQHRQARLKELAPVLEDSIPIGFVYHRLRGKTPSDAIAVAQAFGELSYLYGSAKAGSARLRSGAQFALQGGDVERWVSLSYDLYRGEKRSGTPASQLQELRNEMQAKRASIRGNYVSRGGRLWVSDTHEHVFADLLRDQLLQRPAPDVAFREMEALKAQLLLDQLQRPYSSLRSRGRAERAESIQRSLLDFSDCKRTHADLLMRELLLVSRVPVGALFAGEAQARAVAELEQLHVADKAGFSGSAQVPQLAEVRAALTADEALIEFFIPYNALHPARDLAILVATRQRVSLQTVSLEEVLGKQRGFTGRMSVDGCPPVDSSVLGDAVAELRNYIQRSDEKNARRMLRNFHRLLAEPLIRAGFSPASFKRWIVVPHGPLHYLPFAALIDADQRFLIEHTAITMSPSGAVWFEKQQKALRRPETAAGLFAPTAKDPALPTLPSPVIEMAALRKAFQGSRGRLVEGGRATEQALRELVPGADVLHVSAHGAFPERNPFDYHKILLSPTGSGDGDLQAHEVRGLDLSDAGMVVLAICNGGVYSFGPADEPYGLVPAFLAAGASNVLGTLWPLEDSSGRDFAARLYDRLVDDGPAEALRRAALSAIRDEELIRRWAGFVLVGPGRPYR